MLFLHRAGKLLQQQHPHHNQAQAQKWGGRVGDRDGMGLCSKDRDTFPQRFEQDKGKNTGNQRVQQSGKQDGQDADMGALEDAHDLR